MVRIWHGQVPEPWAEAVAERRGPEGQQQECEAPGEAERRGQGPSPVLCCPVSRLPRRWLSSAALGCGRLPPSAPPSAATLLRLVSPHKDTVTWDKGPATA